MKRTMQAAVQHAIDDIRLEERPVPEIGPGELLLKTLACGLWLVPHMRLRQRAGKGSTASNEGSDYG